LIRAEPNPGARRNSPGENCTSNSGPQSGKPVFLNLFEGHRSAKRLPGNRDKLAAAKLVTDHARAGIEGVGNQILGPLGLVRSLPVKGIDKMFVSRKCLAAFIHLFARELSTCIHVAAAHA